jgi:hypothetical protein
MVLSAESMNPYDALVLAITLDEAKNISIVIVLVLIIAAVSAAWVMKEVMQKLLFAGVLALLAFAVWTQRTSLQDCADKVQESYERVGTDVTFLDTDCSFFGFTVTISDPREDDG